MKTEKAISAALEDMYHISLNNVRAINWTSNFKIEKIWIMFLFYVLSFFKKGDTIQGGEIIQGGTLSI